MSTKHCKNATVFSQKRHARCQTKEMYQDGAGVYTEHVENNLNLVGHTDQSGVVNFYAGRDHLVTGDIQRATPA